MNQASPHLSAAEQSQSARLGGVLFRNRSWIPVPFLAVPLLAPGRMSAANWVVGALLVAAGEAVAAAAAPPPGERTRPPSPGGQSPGAHRWFPVGPVPPLPWD